MINPQLLQTLWANSCCVVGVGAACHLVSPGVTWLHASLRGVCGCCDLLVHTEGVLSNRVTPVVCVVWCHLCCHIVSHLSCVCGVVSAVGKGDCTVRISDNHLMDLVSGKLSPQKVG